MFLDDRAEHLKLKELTSDVICVFFLRLQSDELTHAVSVMVTTKLPMAWKHLRRSISPVAVSRYQKLNYHGLNKK